MSEEVLLSVEVGETKVSATKSGVLVQQNGGRIVLPLDRVEWHTLRGAMDLAQDAAANAVQAAERERARAER